MANIRQNEFLILEKQFEMERGFVLNFSNSSFQQFIYNDCGLDIYNSKYAIRGDSKAKRLRIFWQTESDSIVGKLINEMLAYCRTSRKVNNIEITKEEAIIFNDCLTIANRLRGVSDKTTSKNAETTKDEFLKREYKNININNLDIDAHVIEIIKSRLFEIQRNIHSESALSAVILCGSVLEGLLLGIAIKNIKDFNQSSASPKNRETGKVLLLQDWTLSSLIDVAQNIGFIGLDVKKFSHSLRDFRNYIHPYQQMSTGFTPDIDTAKISWQVLQAAITDLNRKKSPNP
jgi:hypothetical protein